MNFELKNELSYSQTVLKLSICTVLSVLGCILLGYVFMPFAAAYYAALLLYENKGKRVMSYAIPAIMFTLNFFLRAAFSLEAVAYVVVAVLLYFAVKHSRSKSETAAWMISFVVVMILLSALLLAFEMTGNFSSLALRQFYSNIYLNLKNIVIKNLLSLTSVTDEGLTVFSYNEYNANSMFNELILSIVPLVIIFAFILVGLTFKLFERCVRNYSSDSSGILNWRFGASGIVCWFYILVAILSLIVNTGGDIFIYSLIALNTVFAVVFAYIGCRFVYSYLILRGKSPLFSVILIGIAFFVFSSYIISFLSYLGVVVNLISNRSKAKEK